MKRHLALILLTLNAVFASAQLLELYRQRPAGQKVYELYPAILEWSGQFKG